LPVLGKEEKKKKRREGRKRRKGRTRRKEGQEERKEERKDFLKKETLALSSEARYPKFAFFILSLFFGPSNHPGAGATDGTVG
jgi:hypothetical protein